MITRYNFKWKEKQFVSSPVKEEWELVTIIEPISFNEDKTIKEYREIEKYVLHKSLWSDFIKSFDLGSISQQIFNHLEKGTPLVTSHVLPDGDYTPEALEKGAAIKMEMAAKGITLEMLVDAFKKANEQPAEESVKVVEKEAVNG